jgi:phosphohistidine phosphatase
MKKTLVLVRHAKSEAAGKDQKDMERALNDQGYRDALRMGNKFSRLGIKPDAIISSPSERTKQTAEFFIEQFKNENFDLIINENIYDASIRVLINEICDLDDALDTVMIFGHNPGISYFTEYVTKAEIGEMPTCGIAIVTFDIDSWKMVTEGLGKLDFYDYPNKEQIEAE